MHARLTSSTIHACGITRKAPGSLSPRCAHPSRAASSIAIVRRDSQLGLLALGLHNTEDTSDTQQLAESHCLERLSVLSSSRSVKFPSACRPGGAYHLCDALVPAPDKYKHRLAWRSTDTRAVKTARASQAVQKLCRALDDLSLAKAEAERLAAVARRVEFLAVCQPQCGSQPL